MAYFASLNNLLYISEHPSYEVEHLQLDHRLAHTFSALKLQKPVCCIFLTDDDLLEINRSSLQHDYYTDIITFDFTDDPDYSHSELYISLDRIKDNAEQLGLSFVEETHRVIIHGMLHLAGYNDKNDEEQKKMTSMENLYLDLQRST